MHRAALVPWLSMSVAGTFPMAVVAWALMWLTDRLYGMSLLWLIAVPIRLVILCIQVEFLFAALGTALTLSAIAAVAYWLAIRGRDWTSDRRMSLGGMFALLLVPLATELGSVLTALFHNWLQFDEHGMGLIALGLLAMYTVLGWISVVTLLGWFVVAPISLWSRRSVPERSALA